MTRSTALLLALTACGEPLPSQDLDLVAVGSTEIALDLATARVEALLLKDCDTGEVIEIPIEETLDLRDPTPLGVPSGLWCDLGVDFGDDPFDGTLHLEGVGGDGRAFDLALDPGVATMGRDVLLEGDEAVLVLEAGPWLAAAGLDQPGDDVSLGPDDADAEALADTLGAHLVLTTPTDGPAIYIDLWPWEPIHFEASADVSFETQGCGGNTTVEPVEPVDDPEADADADGDADTDIDTDTDGDSDVDSGGSSGGSSGSSGCEGNGCGGSSGSSSGCDGSSAGCSGGSTGCSGGASCSGALCSTSGVLPPAVWLVGLIVLRRRRD
ncbi:MAG: hypothetical protein H6739_07930 [Alphaproteobacteria bacterium]|nr:hypothetical protein [Alphaproteobacteria bacterium]